MITVFDRYWMMYGGKPEVVAEWVGHLDKDLAVWVAAQVAKWYCDALLVVESNTFESEYSKYNESEFIFDTIAGVYDNLYSRTPADKIKEGLPQVYGWHTNRETKPLIVNGYIVDLRDGGYVERSEDTLNEALVYEKKQNGSYGAKAGWHDDQAHACHHRRRHDGAGRGAGHRSGTLCHTQHQSHQISNHAHANSIYIHAGQAAGDGIGHAAAAEDAAEGAAGTGNQQHQAGGSQARTADSEISFQLMRLLPMIMATNTPISMDMVLLPRMPPRKVRHRGKPGSRPC